MQEIINKTSFEIIQGILVRMDPDKVVEKEELDQLRDRINNIIMDYSSQEE